MAARPVSFSFSVWKTLFSVVSLVLLFDHVSALTIRTELQKPIGSSSGTEIRPKQLPSLPVGRTALRRPLGATTASIEQAEQQQEPRFLDEKQLDFTLGYLNKHHEVMLTKFAEVFSPLGAEKAKKNAWSGGSFKILSATIVSIDTQILELDVEVQERKMGSKTKRVEIELGELS